MEILPVRRALWPGLALWCATLAAYFPALRGGFVWNDVDYVTQPELRSLHGLKRIWFDLGATQQYYPVLHSAFWLEHRMWGDAPLGYHLINVILHAVGACLFMVLLQRLWGRALPRSAAWLAGLLFALHPVCVESVAWISEQKNTLSTVFYLLAALGYLRCVDARADGQSSAGTYLLATAWFILALLSKSVTATLPAALLVVLWWRQGSLSWRRDIQPLLPWLAFGAAGGAFTAWVERRFIGAQGPEFDLTIAQRCIVAGRAIWFYLGKLVWPVHLNFIYPRWEPSSLSGAECLYPAGAIALLAVLWRLRTRVRAPLAAMLLFVGSLFPALGFLNVYAFVFSFVADHFQYLASLSIFALAAAEWGCWRRRLAGPESTVLRSGFLLAMAGTIIGALGIMTWRQCRIYRDLPTFYRRILELNPGAWMAHNNLGLFLAGNGRIPEAIAHYEAGLRLKPDDADMQANLGLALDGAERVAEAIVCYQTALRLRPDYPGAEVNLGKALCETGKFLEAIPHFERALRLKPAYLEARFNLAAALGATGRVSESAAQYEEILRLQPNLAAAHHNLAIVLRELGRTTEAHYHDEVAERLEKEGGQ